MSTPTKRFLSLRLKLAIAFTSLLLVVAVFLGGFFFIRYNAAALKWAEQRAQGIALVLSRSAAPALEFEDKEGLEKVLAGLEAAPGAIYGAVRPTAETELAVWNRKAVPTDRALHRMTASEPITTLAGDTLHVFTPVKAIGGAQATLAIGFSIAELKADRSTNLLFTILVVLFALLVGVAASVAVGTLLVKPIAALTAVSTGIVQNKDLSTRIEIRSNDEVGTLADSFMTMAGSLRATIADLRGASEEIEREALGIHTNAKKQSTTSYLNSTAIAQTSTTVEEISQTAKRATEQADMVIDTAKKSDQLSQDGLKVVADTIEAIEHLGQQVRGIANSVQDLSEKTILIADITSTVKEMAEQSNILALNARIEAARAGEGGRGFAVVAKELGTLAEQSKAAAVRIRDILNEIEHGTRAAVAAAEAGTSRTSQVIEQSKRAGEAITGLANVIRGSTEAALQIATNTQQQTVGVEQILSAITNLSSSMSEATAGTRSIEEAANSLTGIAKRLSELVTSYRI